MCRVVMRPLLFRPPVLCLVSTSDFSGLVLVISSNAGNALKRLVGVSGRKVLSAMTNQWLGQFDLVALLERDDCLLPIGLMAESGGTLALLLTGVVTGVDRDDRLFEQLLDRLFDLRLIGVRADTEDILV